jgi:tRNA threonylcarbamoyladenosine modification (KEOPS) complex  Pcc1 subunit
VSAVSPWSATLAVKPQGLATADWLAQALAPEAAREVPRAKATIVPPKDGTLRIEVVAADAGAMRAALNTYLGWVDLALATLEQSGPPRR